MKPDILMILAAGRGKRMKHLTDEQPKPLVRVLGRSLLDRVIDHAVQSDINQIVINTCYKGKMIEDSLKTRTDVSITFSREQEALETGGGVLNALPLLLPQGKNGFFVANADPLWVDKTNTIFEQLSCKWNPDKMDVLLALIPKENAFGAVHGGDYHIINDIPSRKKKKKKKQTIFIQVFKFYIHVFSVVLSKVYSAWFDCMIRPNNLADCTQSSLMEIGIMSEPPRL